jgi:hypothetical protein
VSDEFLDFARNLKNDPNYEVNYYFEELGIPDQLFDNSIKDNPLENLEKEKEELDMSGDSH